MPLVIPIKSLAFARADILANGRPTKTIKSCQRKLAGGSRRSPMHASRASGASTASVMDCPGGDFAYNSVFTG